MATYISVLIVVLGALFSEITCSNHVRTLNDGNFTDRIGEYEVALVKFFAPWSGHSQLLEPEWEKAAPALKRNDPPVLLFEVDCSGNGKATCEKFQIKGYPMMKIFVRGELKLNYAGPKDADGIVRYMKYTITPGSQELVSLLDFDKFLDNVESCVIGFFESEGMDIEKEYKKFADSQRADYRFGHTYSSRILSKYGYRNEIVLFRSQKIQTKIEPSQVKFTDEVRLYKLRSWLVEQYHGLVGVRTMVNREQFRRPLVVVYYKVDVDQNLKETQYWRNRIMMVAKKFATTQKMVHFAMSDIVECKREVLDFGIDVDAVGNGPVVTARDPMERRFVMKGDFTLDTFEEFIENLRDGKLKEFTKSEPLPHKDNTLVKVVVADNFKDVVNNVSKDVLLIFHAPWSEESLDLLGKKLEKLAKKLRNEKDIVIATMDATKNDIPKPYLVKSFPSIYLAKRNSKTTPKLYEGANEIDDLLRFVGRESTNPLKLKGYERNKDLEETEQKAKELPSSEDKTKTKSDEPGKTGKESDMVVEIDPDINKNRERKKTEL